MVIGVHFLPKIELSYGFTLNGLAASRARTPAGEDEMRKGIREGTVAMLLFPENPMDSAPKILDKLEEVFPPSRKGSWSDRSRSSGWGSQAGFVKAKIGIVLALPDPKMVVLGTLQVAVPSADVDPKLRIVDLRVEIVAEFTPDYL